MTTNEPVLIYLASYANPKDPSYQGQNLMAVYADRIVMHQDALSHSYTMGNQLQHSLDWEDIEVALLPGLTRWARLCLKRVVCASSGPRVITKTRC